MTLNVSRGNCILRTCIGFGKALYMESERNLCIISTEIPEGNSVAKTKNLSISFWAKTFQKTDNCPEMWLHINGVTMRMWKIEPNIIGRSIFIDCNAGDLIDIMATNTYPAGLYLSDMTIEVSEVRDE